jgi:CDP-diacylglycerol---glycerol-3-phosphate 3-phosphatidyltransferase
LSRNLPAGEIMTERSIPSHSITHSATISCLLSLCPVVVIACFLETIWPEEYALRWAVGSECIFFTEIGLVLLLGHLWDRRAGRSLINLNSPDYVTIGRGFAAACMGGFLFVPRPDGFPAWIPGILYLAAIAGDFLDGYLARKLRGPTRFGAILDNEFDSAATLLGVLLGILYGRLPPWYLLVGLAHYIFLAGVFWRKYKGLPICSLRENNYRRIIGGANSCFIVTAISPILSEAVVRLLALPFMLFISGSFISDWYSKTGKKKQIQKADG